MAYAKAQRCLRAGVQPPRPRRDHDRLQEYAIVDSQARVGPAVYGEDHAHGRVEEDEVALVLGAPFLNVTTGDGQKVV